MAIFSLVIQPSDVNAHSTDVSPLLEPLRYVGAGRIHIWTKSNLAIGALPYAPEETDRQTNTPLLDPTGRYVIEGDIRLNSRGQLQDMVEPIPASNGEHQLDKRLVLAAYLKWGDDCCNHFDGDYSFAVYDFTSRRLFAASDPLGSHRLFHVPLASGAHVLTSELGCALAIPKLEVNFSIPDLLLWLTGLPLRTRSLFEEVRVVPPGSYFSAADGSHSTTQWWCFSNIITPIRYKDRRDYAEHYRELLRDCVADRIRSSSGKLLIELSGGLDSSSVAALARDLAGPRNLQIATISHIYNHPDCQEERRAIEELRKFFRTPYFDLDGDVLTKKYVPLGIAPRPESPLAFNQPFQIFAAKKAQQLGADVILTGNGGDEMTHGHLAAAYVSRLRQIDTKIFGDLRQAAHERNMGLLGVLSLSLALPLLKCALGPSLTLKTRRVTGRLFPRTDTLNGVSKAARSEYAPAAEALLRSATTPESLGYFEHQFFLSLRTSPSFTVRDAYRLNAGRCGVYAQDPFLDLRLAAFHLSTPPSLWRGTRRAKELTRKAMREYLPDLICEAGKFTVLGPQLEAWTANQSSAVTLVASLSGKPGLASQMRSVLDPGPQRFQTLEHTLPNLYGLLLASWVLNRHS